jgi:hypothetical protein
MVYNIWPQLYTQNLFALLDSQNQLFLQLFLYLLVAMHVEYLCTRFQRNLKSPPGVMRCTIRKVKIMQS